MGRDPLIDVAVALEKAARNDPYFVQRNLYPNVDFYSGLVYRAMGFPPEYFTAPFAVPRAAGTAHWRESLTDPDQKIMRPQQIYQGAWLRDYPDIATRPPASDDQMWQVEPSNASRRRLAGASAPGFGGGGAGTVGALAGASARGYGLGPAFSGARRGGRDERRGRARSARVKRRDDPSRRAFA